MSGFKQCPPDRGADGNGEDEWCCIQALCFGDFHLGQQMFAQRGPAHFAQQSYAGTKVTRLPGRDPAPFK
jgi:hypothetical protein